MDPELKKILDTLPNKPSRSRLEPCREFVEELRRRGRTYREISVILAEKCQVKVSASGIHDFMRARIVPEKSRTTKIAESVRFVSRSAAVNVPAEAPSKAEVQSRINGLTRSRHASPR
jgi:hypothetical protein